MCNWVHWKFLPPSLFLKSCGCSVHFCGLQDLSTYTCKLWLEAMLLSVRETAAAADLSVVTSLRTLAFLKAVAGGTVPFSWLLVEHPSHFSSWLLEFFEPRRMTVYLHLCEWYMQDRSHYPQYSAPSYALGLFIYSVVQSLCAFTTIKQQNLTVC